MAGQFINAPSPSRREARNFENELDIVIVGNKSDKNVTSGQYVTVRDSSISGITNGIYKATANVAAGTAFVAANLSAVTSGALNDLNGNLADTNTKLSSLITYEDVSLQFTSGIADVPAKPGYVLMSVAAANRYDGGYSPYGFTIQTNGSYKILQANLTAGLTGRLYWLKVQ